MMKKVTSLEQVAAFLPLTHPTLTTQSPTRRDYTPVCCNRPGGVSRRSALLKLARTVLSVPAAAAISGGHGDAIAAEFCAPPEDSADSAATIDPATDGSLLITDTVEMTIRAGDSAAERISIGLFGCAAPRTVDNFKRLVADGAYDNTSVYRIVPSLTVQMGDVLHNGGASGGETREAENYRVLHTIPGIVSMVRNRDASIDARFFVATRQGDSQYLDGKYSAFGIVTQGLDKLASLERFAGRANIPRVPVVIEKAHMVDTQGARKLNEAKNNNNVPVGSPFILQGDGKTT